jgi:FkbM family methyltransferase
MLIDIRNLNQTHKLNISGILHVGAHLCEELNAYRQIGVSDDNIVWVEGNPSIHKRIKDAGIKNVYNALISEEEKKVDFIITNNGESSSILELEEHKKEHPHIHEIARLEMNTKRLDNFLKENDIQIPFNFINIDIQGNELSALKSLGTYINQVKYIYTEINTKHLYKNCALLHEIDDYLKKHGFLRLDTTLTKHGWGDAFYMKYK